MGDDSLSLGSAAQAAVLVGTETGDDAGVFLVRDLTAQGTGLVQTVDFITPLVDDPQLFGQIAAANSLSDVYAMGGRPISALNLCVFPKELPAAAARAILDGASQKLREAGAVLLGGHTVRGPELLFGLSVCGIVDPARIWRNVGAQPGDCLLLTKPLGAGLLATGLRRGLVSADEYTEWTGQLTRLNRDAAEALLAFPVSAATDVTGFGLVGHSLGMTRAGAISLRIDVRRLPVYAGALRLASAGVTCGGARNNRQAFSERVELTDEVSAEWREVLFDPQTSGGLLVALPRLCCDEALSALRAAGVSATVIGEVAEVATRPLSVYG
jgi:selenide,water dikinase